MMRHAVKAGASKRGMPCPVPGCTALLLRDNQHLCYAHWKKARPQTRLQMCIAWHCGEPDEFFQIALNMAITEARP